MSTALFDVLDCEDRRVFEVVIGRDFEESAGEFEYLCMQCILWGDAEVYIHSWGGVESNFSKALCIHHIHHYVIFLYETGWSDTGDLSLDYNTIIWRKN